MPIVLGAVSALVEAATVGSIYMYLRRHPSLWANPYLEMNSLAACGETLDACPK
jgi:hypothetical protein